MIKWRKTLASTYFNMVKGIIPKTLSDAASNRSKVEIFRCVYKMITYHFRESQGKPITSKRRLPSPK